MVNVWHNQLLQKYSRYHHWHQHPRHPFWHWVAFSFVAIFVFNHLYIHIGDYLNEEVWQINPQIPQAQAALGCPEGTPPVATQGFSLTVSPCSIIHSSERLNISWSMPYSIPRSGLGYYVISLFPVGSVGSGESEHREVYAGQSGTTKLCAPLTTGVYEARMWEPFTTPRKILAVSNPIQVTRSSSQWAICVDPSTSHGDVVWGDGSVGDTITVSYSKPTSGANSDRIWLNRLIDNIVVENNAWNTIGQPALSSEGRNSWARPGLKPLSGTYSDAYYDFNYQVRLLYDECLNSACTQKITQTKALSNIFKVKALPAITGVTVTPAIVPQGGKYTVTISTQERPGSIDPKNIMFDLRVRAPGSTVDELLPGGQLGLVQSHEVPGTMAIGKWRITGVRFREIQGDMLWGRSFTNNLSAEFTVSSLFTFKTSTPKVFAGKSATLFWSSTGAVSCVASGGWSGSPDSAWNGPKPTSGQEIVTVYAQGTSFTLTCTGSDGEVASKTVNFLVMIGEEVSNLTFNTDTVVQGNSYTATFTGTNLNSGTWFDVQVISPNGTQAEVANWQQGLTGTHTVSATELPGIWTVTGVRPHTDPNDHSSSYIALTASITVAPPPPPSPTPSFSKCDQNHDNSTNVLDLQSLVNVILGKNTCSPSTGSGPADYTCDLNQDSSVNVLDLQYLANVILGKNGCQ